MNEESQLRYILAAIFSYMKANKLSSKKSYEIARKGYLHLRRFLL